MFPFFSRMFPGTNLQDLNLDWICRRIMELSKGIIAPWINPDNKHWMVYDTQTETFVDSGVMAEGIGTYNKPADGIPASDMDASVNASLQKANAAASAAEIAVVINGDTATTGAAAGEYVIVIGSTIPQIVDGLYKAVAAIPANTPISASYLSGPVNGGGLNDINSRIAMATYNLTAETGFTILNWGYCTATIYGKIAIISGGGIVGDAPSSQEQIAFNLPSNIIFASNVFAGFANGVQGTVRAASGTSNILIRNTTTDTLFFNLVTTIN